MITIKKIFFPVLLIFYLVVISGFISSREHVRKIGSVKIRITDSVENQFIHTSDIRKLLDQRNFTLFGKETGSVDLGEIERMLKKRQIVSKAEAYITEPGVLHIDVAQKEPYLRIFNRYGQGYYLDREGNIIPLSVNFSPNVMVASGSITEPFSISTTMNIYEIKHDSLPSAQQTIYNLQRLAGFIVDDEFWNVQIEQIYVTGQGDFELIPRVGSHIIEFGKAEDIEEKFENLKLLYLEGFNNLGWNLYEKISLKYKNQVVCTKIQ
jgi:cell division protein FtsQ